MQFYLVKGGIDILKKIIFIFFVLISISIASYATNEIIQEEMSILNISDFIDKSEAYTEEAFPNLDVNDLLNSAISGKINNKTIYSSILSLFGKEVISAIRVLGNVMIVVIVHSLLKSVSENLENNGVSKITYYVEYILIVTLVLISFSEVIKITKESIQNLVGFAYSLLPILLALVASTGSVISVSVVQPVILGSIVFISNVIQNLIIPILLITTMIGIVSNISEKVQVEKLSKFFKSGIVWFLGVIVTLFVGILSIEGTLSSSVDGVTAKTTKAVVSNFVPVVGKALGDSVDTVLGCTNILKNATGLVGIVIIIGICAMPIIKLTILSASFKLVSALSEPIADKNIVKLLGHIGDVFKILLAIMFFIAVMLIVGITIIIKISNSGLMYR